MRDDDLRATQTVEEMRDWRGRFIHLRIEPDGMCVFPAAGTHDELEILSAADVGDEWTRWFACLHVRFVGDFASIGDD